MRVLDPAVTREKTLDLRGKKPYPIDQANKVAERSRR